MMMRMVMFLPDSGRLVKKSKEVCDQERLGIDTGRE
jgi:hypothetical protein